MIITKKDLAHSIYKRFDKTIKIPTVQDIVTIVFDSIVDDLSHGRAFSVQYFGTFSTYRRQGRRSLDVNTRKIRMSRSVRRVQFRPHTSFLSLLDRRWGKVRGKPKRVRIK